MSGQVPDRDQVLLALKNLLGWAEISRSPQLGKFIDYIVQRTLSGEAQSIKAYSIAVDVFGRPADFDPQSDPIVRVQARRLRSLLDDFYAGPGAAESVQIRLPVGRYIPDFVVNDTPRALDLPEVPPAVQPELAQRNRAFSALAIFAVAIAIAAGYFLWRSTLSSPSETLLTRPRVTIVEFQNLATETGAVPQAAGLAIELLTELEQFESITPTYRPRLDTTDTTSPAANDFVLTGIVRAAGSAVQYSALLTNSQTGNVVWNQTLSVSAEEAALPAVLDRLAQSFSLALGGPRGPLHAPARAFLAGTTDVTALDPYLCRVLFGIYRETASTDDSIRARTCFTSLPAPDQSDPIVMALLGTLIAEAEPPEGTTQAEQFELAQASLDQAVAADPISGLIWEQQARLHEAEGNLALAQADYASSVQLNPTSPDAVAAYARRLAFSGALGEAAPLSNFALTSPAPPAWYYSVPTLLALRDGDHAMAIDYAEIYARADRELGPVLAIMAAQQAGASDVINRYLPEVLDTPSFRANGILPALRKRITDDALTEQIRAALTDAGVPWNSLVRSF